MFDHAALTIDTGKLSILSGWNASTNADSSILIRLLENDTFGSRRGTWREALRHGVMKDLGIFTTSWPSKREAKGALVVMGESFLLHLAKVTV